MTAVLRPVPPIPLTWPQVVVNRKEPSLWCRLFHEDWWASNDFGTWWISGRKDFEVECQKCGGAWKVEKHD